MSMPEHRTQFCALCMIDGVRSKPIDNWPYMPICREHMAETLARTNGQPVVVSTLGRSSQSPSLH